MMPATMQVVTRLLLLAAFLMACATGGSGATGDDVQPKQDAAVKQDAPVSIDARMIDAHVPPIDGPPIDAPPPPIDAPPQGGGFCQANADCIAAECCFVVACVPGTRIGSACFPS